MLPVLTSNLDEREEDTFFALLIPSVAFLLDKPSVTYTSVSMPLQALCLTFRFCLDAEWSLESIPEDFVITRLFWLFCLILWSTSFEDCMFRVAFFAVVLPGFTVLFHTPVWVSKE